MRALILHVRPIAFNCVPFHVVLSVGKLHRNTTEPSRTGRFSRPRRRIRVRRFSRAHL